MAKINKKEMSFGAFLAMSFIGVLVLIFSPVFGEGKNGLVFSDDLFNKLSKGSSHFIPAVSRSNENFIGNTITATITMGTEAQVEHAVRVLTTAGAQAEASGSEIRINADLGMLMSNALKDSEDMYTNNGQAVRDRYGFDEKEVMVAWWNVMGPLDKQLKKGDKIPEAKIVSDVMKKAVETSHNFYGIEAQQVSEKAGLMTGLLVFYVIYTMWWGFAIFFLFEGFGLSMSKAKH
jgi:hypothetical protein